MQKKYEIICITEKFVLFLHKVLRNHAREQHLAEIRKHRCNSHLSLTQRRQVNICKITDADRICFHYVNDERLCRWETAAPGSLVIAFASVPV